MVKHLKDLALEQDELISECETKNMMSRCQWTRIVNAHGVCYTMNMIDSADLFRSDV